MYNEAERSFEHLQQRIAHDSNDDITHNNNNKKYRTDHSGSSGAA